MSSSFASAASQFTPVSGNARESRRLDLTGSLVLYRNRPEEVTEAIRSFLNAELVVRLYIVDNSPDDRLRVPTRDPRIEYVFNGKNVGFGAGHNVALRRCMRGAPYHVILNPDIYFGSGVIEKLLDFVRKEPDIGLVMPKVLNPDGSTQFLCKRLPTPGDLVLRRFLPSILKPLVRKRLEHYEMRDHDYGSVLSAPVLSGCFMMINWEALSEVGIFDERYFMYLEDVDLCRRVGQLYETIYCPAVAIYHHHGRGSYHNVRPLIYHIISAVRYFQKWGWFSDSERVRINQERAGTWVPDSALAAT